MKTATKSTRKKKEKTDPRDRFNATAQRLTAEIIEGIQNGDLKWEKMWNPLNAPKNYFTKRHYNGFNAFYLNWVTQKAGYTTPNYITFKQALDLKGNVRKGEKGRTIVFWKVTKFGKEEKEETQDDDAGPKKKFIPFTWTVFNIDQCEGIEFKTEETILHEFKGIQACEEVFQNYDGPKVTHGGDRAYYSPSLDIIGMPIQKAFKSDQAYYATLFHEMVHSTGHKSRLARFGETATAAFGSINYSKEELIAEIGSACLNAWTGIENDTFKNSLAYLKGWIKPLNDDPQMIINAAQKAHQASRLILNMQLEYETGEE